jgi:hypothetical protein
LISKGRAKPDPSKVLVEVLNTLQGRITVLETKVTDSFRDVFANQQQLKAALDSAEYNLRSHQKVISACVAECERLFSEKTPEALEKGFKYLKAKITDDRIVIDWPTYHQYVTDDLEDLNRIEDERQKTESLQMANAIKEDLEWFTERKKAEVSKLESEPQLAAEKTLSLFLARASAEVDNVLAGKDFDFEKLKKVFRLFATERTRASKETEEAPAIPSEEPEPGNEPEGATIFGGT